MSRSGLVVALQSLPPWPSDRDLTPDEWSRYLAAGHAVQESDADELDGALGERVGEGLTAETGLFVLSRVVFELPERAPVEQRRTWKGWTNWPAPDDDGAVDLSWPVHWDGPRPRLSGYFEGAEGPRYAVLEEFHDLRERFPLRRLPE